MKFAIAALVVTVALPAFAGKTGSDAKADVQAAFDKVAAAINAHDAKAFVVLWVDDGEIINPAGISGKGKDGIEKVITGDMDTILKGTKSSFTVDSVRKIGDALFSDVTHTAENATMHNGKIGTLKAHVVALLVKKGKALMQSSPPRSRRCRSISRPASCSAASALETFAR